MKEFMGEEFLLENQVARHLYRAYAADAPILDYHCHVDARDIDEDRRFDDLAQLWLGGHNPDGTCFGDHYKWRLMRSNGVPEEVITGETPGYERILQFAKTLEKAPGNPMYHWCHLELRQFFGYTGVFSAATAKTVWDLCNEKLRSDPDLTVRGILKKAKVQMVGTTDDPLDDLAWHKKIREDPTISVEVCPSFRPDKALNITKPGFADYIRRLMDGRDATSVEEVCHALEERLAYFCALGCRAADHGLDYMMYRPCTPETADGALRKAMAGAPLTLEEAEGYQTAVLTFLGKCYRKWKVVMQLHYSCLRNVNERAFAQLGPDTGFDMIASTDSGGAIARLLSALERDGGCPKTILYSLNPADNAQLGTLIGCFQSDRDPDQLKRGAPWAHHEEDGSPFPGRIQHGAAWWFNDTRDGMEAQLKSLASLGLLGNFVGMLTDSRSFLSYARHDYFRRILCNLLGTWVENGEYPNDEGLLGTLVSDICSQNAARYFGV
ncbi:MAG: glucuronate isomerase [Oscillospiraceae bacterium]